MEVARRAWDRLAGTLGDGRRNPDALIVGVLVVWVLLTSLVAGIPHVLLGIAQAVPLLYRRSHPLGAALGVAAAALVQVVLTDSPHAGNVAVLVAVYSAAAFGTRRESFLVLALGLVGAAVAALDWWGPIAGPRGYLFAAAGQGLVLALAVMVVWALGDVVRRRRAVVGRLAAQDAALARDHVQQTRLAAQSERATIAREMHDVVAHSLAVVVVQADGALYAAGQALASPPSSGPDRAALERAAQTLETVAATARGSLADTRRLVGVLREDGFTAELEPQQGLAELGDLVGRVRDSGLQVHLEVRGAVDDLPPEVDRAAYRVVQEGLTNVLKHAGPDPVVEVDVLRMPTVLVIRITDDGEGPAGPVEALAGNGLVGMAERVEVLDGTLHAGPRGRGGWEVLATIPAGGQAAGQAGPDGRPT